MNNLTPHDPRTYKIIGAAIEVHCQLGCGFLESVYQEALALELKIRNIPFRKELTFNVTYKGHRLNSQYRPDFICFEDVIVELKALSKLSSVKILS
jgi:GxxExxY protein